MSRTIPSGLLSHLQGECHTLAHLLKLTRKDATVLGFTDHDADIAYGGAVYEAATGANLTAISGANNLSVDTLDATMLIDSEKISEADIRAGLYDLAEIRIYLVNYADLGLGNVTLFRGWLGEVTQGQESFTAELRSLFQAYSQNIVELYSPACRADLGDSRCKVNLESLTVTGLIDSVNPESPLQVVRDVNRTEATGFFDMGKLTWTTGSNAGRSVEVKHWDLSTKEFTLNAPMPESISAGNRYSVYPGCDKTIKTCEETYSNSINFRGEPYVPGTFSVAETTSGNYITPGWNNYDSGDDTGGSLSQG